FCLPRTVVVCITLKAIPPVVNLTQVLLEDRLSPYTMLSTIRGSYNRHCLLCTASTQKHCDKKFRLFPTITRLNETLPVGLKYILFVSLNKPQFKRHNNCDVCEKCKNLVVISRQFKIITTRSQIVVLTLTYVCHFRHQHTIRGSKRLPRAAYNVTTATTIKTATISNSTTSRSTFNVITKSSVQTSSLPTAQYDTNRQTNTTASTVDSTSNTTNTLTSLNFTSGQETQKENLDKSVFSWLILVAVLANIGKRPSVYGAFVGILCFSVVYGICFLLRSKIKTLVAGRLSKTITPLKVDELPVLDSKCASHNVSNSSTELTTSSESSASNQTSRVISKFLVQNPPENMAASEDSASSYTNTVIGTVQNSTELMTSPESTASNETNAVVSKPLLQSSLSIESLISAMTFLGNDTMTIRCKTIKRPNSNVKEVEIEIDVPQDSEGSRHNQVWSYANGALEEEARTYSRRITQTAVPNDYDYIDESLFVPEAGDSDEALDQTEVVDQTEALDQTEVVDQTEVIDQTEVVDQLVLADKHNFVDMKEILDKHEIIVKHKAVEENLLDNEHDLMNKRRVDDEQELVDVYDNNKRVSLEYLNIDSFDPYSSFLNGSSDHYVSELPLKESSNYVNVDCILSRSSSLQSSLV
ncbi:hypothetical protein BgiBS90_028869, partial [Biomphalaria glabrata]